MARKADPVQQTAYYTKKFWESVARADPDECWLWTGDNLTWNGYGAFYAVLDGRKYGVHPTTIGMARSGRKWPHLPMPS